MSPAERRRAAASRLASKSNDKLPYDPRSVPLEAGLHAPVATAMVRLTAEVYADLESKVPLHMIPGSELEAAWQNGAEYVLRLVRNGYTLTR